MDHPPIHIQRVATQFGCQQETRGLERGFRRMKEREEFLGLLTNVGEGSTVAAVAAIVGASGTVVVVRT
jgi:hypothetical protein